MINFNSEKYKILKKNNGVYSISFRDPLDHNIHIVKNITKDELNKIEVVNILNVHYVSNGEPKKYINLKDKDKDNGMRNSNLSSLHDDAKSIFMKLSYDMLSKNLEYSRLKKLESKGNTDEIKERMRVNSLKIPLLTTQIEEIRKKLSIFKSVIIGSEKSPFIASKGLSEALNKSKNHTKEKLKEESNKNFEADGMSMNYNR